MTWINNFFIILILNSITGGFAHLGWYFIKTYLERRDKIKMIYPLLKIVLVFYSIPIVYMLLTLANIRLEYDLMNGGITYGIVGVNFSITPTIANVIKIVVLVWFIGMIWNLCVYFIDYFKLSLVMRRNTKVTNKSMKSLFDNLYCEMQIKEKVSFCQNYALTSPIVTGTFHKCIVLPDRPYGERELMAVLYHEFTHVKKKDLMFKKMGILLSLIIWFNPIIHLFKGQVEEWSETVCDLNVCYNMKNPMCIKEYFNYALKGLHDNYNISTKLAMQFNNEHNLKRRVLRVKRYSGEKEIKGVVGVAIALVFSLVCTSTAYAAGKGVEQLYEIAHESTVVEICEGDGTSENYLTEYTGSIDMLDDSIEIIQATESPLSRSMAIINWTVKANQLYQSSSFTKSSGSISVAVEVSKSARVGIIEPSGSFRYVSANGYITHSFPVYQSGLHYVYVQNVSSSDLTAQGTYNK